MSAAGHVPVHAPRFQRRLARLVKCMAPWQHDAIVLVMGKAADHASEPKTSSMHLWLLTIEFPESVIAICRDGRVIFWMSSKKMEYLRPIESPNVKFVTRTLPLTGVDGTQMEAVKKDILNGKDKAVVGLIQKEVHVGPFVETVLKGLGEMQNFEIRDCREEISHVLAPKEAEEIALMKKASLFCSLVMKEFVNRLVGILDGDSDQPKISSQLCNEIEAIPDEEDLVNLWTSEHHFEEGELEIAEVSLQHGKALKLKATEPVDCSIPMQGTYLLTLGVKYMEYSAVTTRTIVIDPGNLQKKAYGVAIAAHKAIINTLVPGKSFRDLFLAAKGAVELNDKTLVPKLGHSVGRVLGMEYKDPQSFITEKSTRVVEPGMVFNIAVGMVENLPDGSGQEWAVWIGDTVLLPLEPGAPLVLTAEVSKDAEDIMYHLDAAEEMQQQPNASQQPPSQPADATLPLITEQQPKPAAPPPAAKAAATAAPVEAAAGDVPAPKVSAPAPKAKEAAAKATSKPTDTAAKGKAKAEAKPKAKAKEKAAAPPPKAKANAGGQPPAVRVSTRNQKAAAPPPAPATAAPPRQAPAPPRVRIAGAAQPADDSLRSSRRLRSRNEQTKNDIQTQVQMDQKMIERRLVLLEQQRERFKNMAAKIEESTKLSTIANLKAYSSPNDLPPNLRPNRIHVDMQAEALLVPIFGTFVPFNARTLKNITKSRSDQTEYLRVNFITPGQQGKNAEDFPVVGGRRMCIKEMSFRSDSVENFDKLIRAFKELQKQMRQKDLEGEKGKLASEAGKGLQLARGSNFPNITDVQMRPNVSSSKKTIGNLEAHTTGFRFTVRGTTERVDILYSQVKLAIFEPCAKHTLMAIIHFHLREPIIFGAKRTQDVQFFTEVGTASEDLSQRKAGSIHDPDEIQEEQFDRILRKRLNEAFQTFAKKVQAINTCTLKFDMPLHDIMFSGVPYRANVDLCPCGQALVALQSWPPFCLCLSDIECVVFERDIMSLHELDIAFVLKDYEKPPPRVTAVPRKYRDMIRSWLFDNDVVWFSSQLNMNWKEVIAEVTKDPKQFVENGGWNQWFDEGESDEGGNNSDDMESDYKASGSDDSPEDHAPGSDDGSDFDADDDDESSAEMEDDDDEESGQDWEELERRAEREDRRRDAEKRAAQHSAPAAGQKPAKRARR